MNRTLSRPRTLLGLLAASALLSTIAAAGCSDGVYPMPMEPAEPISMTEEAPPAISGGTLMVTKDGRTAVAADADRHGIWVVDLETSSASFLPVEKNDEPGRVVEDGDGRAHVALRRGGALVTVDIAAREITARRDVCTAPRGLAYDATSDVVHVACAGGELLTLPAAGGAATRKLRLDRDLRDVVVHGDELLISRFRSAETLVVSAEGEVVERRKLPEFVADSGAGSTYAPSVAWRMTALPGGGAAMVHQRSMTTPIVIAPGGYYASSGCDGNIVHSAISLIDPDDVQDDPSNPPRAVAAVPSVGLPVDVAVAPNGDVAIVGASNDLVVRTSRVSIENESGIGSCYPTSTQTTTPGQPVALAFTQDSKLVVQLREPAMLLVGASAITLPGDSVKDTGHEMFHRSPSGFAAMSCASCHPEGHEDGHTWNFDPIGMRRTQEIGGGILKTAPLHWDGDQHDLSALMSEVFVSRMSGAMPGGRRLKLMERFIDSLPAQPASPPDDLEAVARGEAIFSDAKVGCADCHSGAMLTNNRNEDIGKGKALQTPTLVGVASRAPFMHDGCAATLRDRFDPACGGTKHGNVSGLSEAQIDDLVAYLESL
jgi:mono/diheme cytochrome c family protein